MKRIGIFGAENSHAMAFSKNFNSGTHPGYQVVAIGGEDPEASKKIVDECGVAFVAASPADMIGKIDAAMVTSRDGGLHYKYAKTFIEAGLPTFVDKPVTNTVEDALALIALAKAKNVPLLGGSSVKLMPPALELAALREAAPDKCAGGYVCAPVSMVNDYGNFYFYSAHLVELCLKIFGMKPESVDAFRSGNDVTAVVHYPTFDVSCHFLEGIYSYAAVLQMRDGSQIRTISLDGCYDIEVDEYVKMVETGHMPQSYEQLIQSVYLINAIKTAYETGARQTVGSSIL